MRAHVNNLALRAPGIRPNNNITSRLLPLKTTRRFFSDAVVSSAAVKTAPAEELRPPLTDLHARRHNYLRISLTERCNLRCQYCMPAEGVKLSPRTALLTRPEITRLVQIFVSLGVDKVRLTGGEPTIRSDLADIIGDIRQCGIPHIGMTSNALALSRRLPALQRAGLTALNISLDSLRIDRYTAMARVPGLPKVLAGIDLALQLGYSPVKINTVLMKGFNDDEICDFVEFTRDRDVEVRFIEFMPFSGNSWKDSRLVDEKRAMRIVAEKYPDVAPCAPRPNDTARVWQVAGFSGRVGFISSMTNNFCGTCNRLRLTADGNLKVCLFGAAEVSLRDAMRSGASDDHIEGLIRTALNNKKAKHAESGPNGEPTHDSNRGIATHRSGTFPAGHEASADFRCNSTSETQRKSSHRLPPKFRYSKLFGSSNFGRKSSAKTASNPSNSAIYSSQLATVLSQDFPSKISQMPDRIFTNLSKKSSVLLTPELSPASKAIRFYSTSSDENVLSHLDREGKARMVDVGDKPVTSRTAEAECSLHVGGRLIRLLRDARIPKGDALTVAQVAGVVGAKRTSDLIPMCHPLPLDCVRIYIKLPKGECSDGGDIHITCEVKVTSRTGAEMEALTGAAISALSLYDMCKSVDKNMKVNNLRVVSKTGGRSGDWSAKPVQTRAYDTTPLKPGETFVPTMNF